jgi:hypothetical protein
MTTNITRRCCVCKSAIIGGVLIPEEKYSPQNKTFSDGILSRECSTNFYGEDFENISFEYISCRTGIREH